MPADPNTNKLDYAGLTRYHGKIQQQLIQQSQQIAALKALGLSVVNGEVCQTYEEE